jgi:EAL domain-containing protein (putative c-di-GMP-specific phosphodiesterase class I)/CHASE3 domain sensor protein
VTPLNRILLAVGGAATIACLVTVGIFAQTSAAFAALRTEELAADSVQALGDELRTEIHEQLEALDDYMLSGDARALARYRLAVSDADEAVRHISGHAGRLAGVTDALALVAAENDHWRLTVAVPAIAAVKSGSAEALQAAIRAQIDDQETSQVAISEFVLQIDDVEAELGARHSTLDALRVAAGFIGLIVELVAAAFSLWFVRRYGLTVSRDIQRRARASAERIEIVASLRSLRTQSSPEATALVIGEALHRLPGIDVAGVFESTSDGMLALAVVGLPGFPIQTGDPVPRRHVRHLLERSNAGPWAEKFIRPAESNAYDDRLAALGIRSRAFAPIVVDGNLVAVLGVATISEDHAEHLVEDLPAVGEFASLAETILGPALLARQHRATERRRFAGIIASTAFRPVFQPVVELATGTTVGFEALTRFEDGSRPDTTFAAAIACGMGIELEMVALAFALRAARQLPQGAWLSLNVSPALLAREGVTLGAMVADRGPVVLEVTEHAVIDAYAPLREAMLRLGPEVRLAVDDAGAGVANFNHLVELRPTFVKIDASLVRGVDTDLSRQAVVVGLIHFAARTGAEVIAEGIETAAERATVIELGVKLGQGYLMARGATEEEERGSGVVEAPSRPPPGLEGSRESGSARLRLAQQGQGRISRRASTGATATSDRKGDRTRQQRLKLGRHAPRVPVAGSLEETGQVVLDLLEVVNDHRHRRMRRVRDLDRRVQVGAATVALGLEPDRDLVEEAPQDYVGRAPGSLRSSPDPIEPTGSRVAQPGHDEVVLGRKVAIERRLGDRGLPDDGIDAGRLDAHLVEELRGRRQQPLPSRGPLGRTARPQDTANDGGRMDAEDIRHGARAMAAEVIRADEDVGQAGGQPVDLSLVGQEVGHDLGRVDRPLGAADVSRPRVPQGQALVVDLPQEGELSPGIEPAATEVGIVPRPDHELARSRGCRGVDAGLAQSLEMDVAKCGVDDMERAVALLEALDDEGEQHVVGLVAGIGKDDRVLAAEFLAAQPNGSSLCMHQEEAPLLPDAFASRLRDFFGTSSARWVV